MEPSGGWSVAKFAGKIFSGGLDWVRRRFKKDDEIHQLCTLVAFALEDYMAGCYDVSHDGGEEQADGRYQVGVSSPELDLRSLNPDWLLLSRDLRYRLIALPKEIEQIRGFLSNSEEHASPPDYSEYFHARQRKFAALGVEVGLLALDVRKYGRLPRDARAAGLLQEIKARQEVHQGEDRERDRRALEWQKSYRAMLERTGGQPNEYDVMTAIMAPPVTITPVGDTEGQHPARS